VAAPAAGTFLCRVRILNLGIMAHVDAGKTSLTERLLYLAGVIEDIGSVDAGTSQTDTMELERQRGITIKSAVVSFVIADVVVNLIDTPGHPDFIAEVERVLRVLDGAVLVISAVEGVQPQTRVLMRALQRLHIPTILFVNKIDRVGAQEERLLRDISRSLTPSIVAMGTTCDLGTRSAGFVPYALNDARFLDRLVELLVDHAPHLVDAYLDDADSVSAAELCRTFVDVSRNGDVHPVFFGSAITGAGVEEVLSGITQYLPAEHRPADVPLDGLIFKIERGRGGDRIAFVRLFSGTLATRDRVGYGRDSEQTVTGLQVFDRGDVVPQQEVTAGRIAKVWGLGDARIGDRIGVRAGPNDDQIFAPPTLEAVVVPRDLANRRALHAALLQLSEQDPLIGLRADEFNEQRAVTLYGEVQKQVIEATLQADYGLAVEFLPARPICIERPTRVRRAMEIRGRGENPVRATIGIRIEPGRPASGLHISSEVKVGSIPVAIQTATEDAVRATLRQGLWGWQVTDCSVIITHLDHRPPPTPAGEFRKLAPLVVAAALRKAAPKVCEPVHRYRLELPAEALSAVMAALAKLRAYPDGQSPSEASAWVIEGQIASARLHELQEQVPGLAHGEGVLDVDFDSYRPVEGQPPVRPRSDFNPFNREEYLLHVSHLM